MVLLDSSRRVSAWYGTVQSFAILGFLGVNLAFLLIILQIFVDKCKGVKEIAFWNFVQCIITGMFRKWTCVEFF